MRSATAFHNGSMIPTGDAIASPEMKNVLDPILGTAIGHEPQKRAMRCPKRHSRYMPESPSYRLFGSLVTTIPGVKSLWRSLVMHNVPEQPALHPTAQIFQDEMLRLAPFADMKAEALSKAAVAVVLPAWLVGTEEACHIAKAAERSFGWMLALENPPSAAYTAAGYELCRISYDAFKCTGPGRIMTLEHDGHLFVATIIATPLLYWSSADLISSVRRGLAPEEMTRWLDSFIGSQKPDRVILSGTGVDQPSFMDLLRRSGIRELLEAQPPLPTRNLLAFGAAQVAKDTLESQRDDCSESRECEELRRQADAISGSFRHPVPSVWPPAALRHDEL